jgi:hypothetical protein
MKEHRCTARGKRGAKHLGGVERDATVRRPAPRRLKLNSQPSACHRANHCRYLACAKLEDFAVHENTFTDSLGWLTGARP